MISKVYEIFLQAPHPRIPLTESLNRATLNRDSSVRENITQDVLENRISKKMTQKQKQKYLN